MQNLQEATQKRRKRKMIVKILLAIIAIEIGTLTISVIILNWQLKKTKEEKVNDT